MNTNRLLRCYLRTFSLMILLGSLLGMALYSGRQRERARWAKQRIAADEAKIQDLQRQSHLDQQHIRDLEGKLREYEAKKAETPVLQEQAVPFESNEITTINSLEVKRADPGDIDWGAQIRKALK